MTQTEVNEPSDYPQGYYHVYVSYATGHKPACVDLAKLADILPHGSGIDGSWYLNVRRNGDVGVTGEYHAMDENGMYCGWRNFRFSLVRCKRMEFHPLMGPCAGKVQITKRKGTVYLQSFIGGGDASDYLFDTVSCAISEAFGISTISSDVVTLSEARNMGYNG